MGGTPSRGTKDLQTGIFIGKGSVFDSPPTDSLICFTTKTFNLNGRIRKEFGGRFGGQQFLKQQGKNKGEIIPVKIGEKYVYYLVVKDGDHKKATTTDLRTCLDAVVTHATANGITNISIPDESFVEITKTQLYAEIDEAFNGSGINYTIATESNIV